MDGTLEEKKNMIASRMGFIQTKGDKKVCKACAAAQADGKPHVFPLHPNCRCGSKASTPVKVLEA